MQMQKVHIRCTKCGRQDEVEVKVSEPDILSMGDALRGIGWSLKAYDKKRGEDAAQAQGRCEKCRGDA